MGVFTSESFSVLSVTTGLEEVCSSVEVLVLTPAGCLCPRFLALLVRLEVLLVCGAEFGAAMSIDS